MASRFLVSLLATTTIIALTGEAKAFEVKHAADGNLVSWRRANVSWTIDSSVRKVQGGEDAVAAAALAWSQRSGAPALAVEQVDAKLEPGLDGTNAVFFVEGGFAPAGNALAVTVLSFDDRTGEVLDADIVLNGKYHLGSVANGTTHPAAVTEPGGETYDIGRVIAHEMGHALALSDEYANKSALMNPYVPRGVALATSPGDDDLAGLTTLYGSAESADLAQAAQAEHLAGAGSAATAGSAGSATGCAVATAPRPLRAPATIYVAAGLALAALAMARGARAPRARRGAAGCTVLAATALFVLPAVTTEPAPHRREIAATVDAKAIVTNVSTISLHGVFRSEVELSTTSCASNDCPPVSRFVTWGGTIGHVRQVIGGVHVPVMGDSVGLVLEHRVVRRLAPLSE